MSLVESVELAILVLESGIIEEVVSEVMAHPEVLTSIESSETIKSSIKNQLNAWKVTINKKLLLEPIEQDINKEIEYYYQVQAYSEQYFFEEFENIVATIDINSPFHEQATEIMIQKEQKHNPLFKYFFCEKWYQSIFNNLQQSQLQKLQIEKTKLLEDLYQRQETINQLSFINSQADHKTSMRLWDMAKAKLTQHDIQSLHKITKLLNKHNELQKIAEQLGRIANTNDDHDINLTQTQKVSQNSIATDNTGDIIGINQSDNIEKLLPTELMFLAHPELEVIFYKHLAEKRLKTYQQKSIQKAYNKVTHYQPQSKKADQDKGPFIIAIDASGSMMGLAEQCAKAFAYGLMQIALAEDRSCYVIIFSAQQITYELTKNNGLSEMLSFLSYRFNGGTDITSVLEKAFTLMEGEKYKNADLIVLSDFIAPAISSKTLEKLNYMKVKNNRFHALSLSPHRNSKLLAIFDQHWIYNPSRLANFKRLFSK